jgi:type II secretory pathway pseudopilin PulG
MTRFSRRAQAADEAPDDTGGFTLVEVIVALGLILFVMSASVPFFVRSLQTSSTQQVREAAVALADQGMEQARAVQASSMASGRNQTLAQTNWNALPAAASQAMTQSSYWYDSSALPGATPLIPWTVSDSSTLVNRLQYTVDTEIGKCWITSTSSQCTTTSGSPSVNTSTLSGATPLYRVIVDVHWAPKPGEICPVVGLLKRCDYVITSLRDPSADPLFNSAA